MIDLDSGDGRCVQLVATANARAWLDDRFAHDDRRPAEGLDQRGRPAADLAGVVARATIHAVGTSLEADLLWLELARARCPAERPNAADRLTFLDIREEQGVPRLVPIDALADRPTERAIGPFLSRAAARSYAAMGALVLDMCRHPSLLEPGSSEASSYREALGEWLAWRPPQIRARHEQARASMRAAVASQAFEEAAHHRAVIEAIESFTPGRLSALETLERFQYLVIAPAAGGGVQPMVVGVDRWARLPARSCEKIAPELVLEADAADTGAWDLTRVAVASRYLLKPTKRVVWFRLGETIRASDLLAAARSASGRTGLGPSAPESTSPDPTNPDQVPLGRQDPPEPRP